MNNLIIKKNEKIENVEKNYYSFPSTFYKGIINPTKKKIINSSITINSLFRDNYYTTKSSDFIYELPIDLNNVVSMKVIDIQIPTNKIYNISNYIGNNFFIIKNDATSYVEKIIVPDGNYTNNNLIQTLNNIFSGLSTEFKHIYFYINNQNNETIIALKNTSPYNYTFTLDFNNDLIENKFSHLNNIKTNNLNLKSKLGWILGFRYNIYETKNIYVSEGFIQTNQLNIFLSIDDFNDNQFINHFEVFNNVSLLPNNIISEIYFNYRNKINFKNFTSIKRNYYGGVNIRKLQIKLIDIYGKVIDLNNCDFNFTLLFEVIYNNL